MSKLEQILETAVAQIGDPYVWAAEGPDAFDCSGLTQYAYAAGGFSLPRTARAQQDYVKAVSNPQPGDLVFWGNPATHVGIYVGGGQVLDAPRTGEKVKIRAVWGSPTYGRVPGVESDAPAAVKAAKAALGKLGSAFDWVKDKLGDGAGAVAGTAADALNLPDPAAVAAQARNVVIEGVFVVLGVGLVGYGVYRAVTRPAIQKTLQEVAP